MRRLSTEFMAGLMTGEGWFGFTTFKLQRKPLNIRPGFAITMNDIETMHRFIETAKSMGLEMYIVDIRRSGPLQRPGLRVDVRGIRRTKVWLDIFLPRLTGRKREAAELVDAYIRSRLSKPTAAPVTEAEIDLVGRSKQINGYNANRKSFQWVKPKDTYARRREAEPEPSDRKPQSPMKRSTRKRNL